MVDEILSRLARLKTGELIFLQTFENDQFGDYVEFVYLEKRSDCAWGIAESYEYDVLYPPVPSQEVD